MNTCKICQHFFDPDSDGLGECRFYPKAVDKLSTYWCGQFKEKDVVRVGREMSARSPMVCCECNKVIEPGDQTSCTGGLIHTKCFAKLPRKKGEY